MNNFTIVPMNNHEAPIVESIIKKVFDLYIGPDYVQEGVETFYDFIKGDHIIERICNQMHQVLIAKINQENKIVGIIETRDDNHICLLFVDPSYHKQGIAKKLFSEAFKGVQLDITVNSSPYAVSIYERLGFTKISGEIIKNGITYIPMIKEQKNSSM